jgi:hypothetical protein
VNDGGYMTRQEANRLIIKLLAEQVEKDPDIRFGQMLRNVGAVYEYMTPDDDAVWRDEFYLEPQQLLKRIQQSIKEYGL